MKNKKIEPWIIVVAILSIGFIIYMWTTKNIAEIYGELPTEQLIPLIVTNMVVSLIKVVGITGGILLIKWIVSKFKR